MQLMSEASKEATVEHARRWGGWWMGVVGLIAVIGFVANQQLPVLMFKVSQVCLGVGLAYWADRTLFRHTVDVSPDLPRDIFGAARLLARAIIVLAIVVGVTIGI